jgi:hypothetical protein
VPPFDLASDAAWGHGQLCDDLELAGEVLVRIDTATEAASPQQNCQATPSSARQRPWAKATGDEPDDWDLSGDTFDSVEDAKAYFDKAAGRA